MYSQNGKMKLSLGIIIILNAYNHQSSKYKIEGIRYIEDLHTLIMDKIMLTGEREATWKLLNGKLLGRLDNLLM